MALHAGQLLRLLDGASRRIGEVTIERIENDLLFATIQPGPDFVAVEPLFRAFEEAAELQALKKVDELSAEIAARKLHLVTPDEKESVPVQDVQVWSDSGMTCRLMTADVVPEVSNATELSRFHAPSLGGGTVVARK